MKDFARVAKAIFRFYRYLLGVPAVLGLIVSIVAADPRILAVTGIALAALAIIPWILLLSFLLLGLILVGVGEAFQRFGLIFGTDLRARYSKSQQENSEVRARDDAHRLMRYKMYYGDSGRIIR